jgi:hypothetical protein
VNETRQAKTVIVAGEQDGTRVRLRISDDGVGFDPTVSHSGIGLTSMREPLRLVDDELLINSSPSRGSEIIAHASAVEARSLAAKSDFVGIWRWLNYVCPPIQIEVSIQTNSTRLCNGSDSRDTPPDHPACPGISPPKKSQEPCSCISQNSSRRKAK